MNTKISVIIPCFNEEATVVKLLYSVESALLNYKNEIILVDDFSSDNTRALLKDISIENLKIIYHEKNMGKGAAIRTGISNATGDIIVIQDADLEYDPQDYNKILNPILSGKADVVYGSRFLGQMPHRVLYFWHRIGNGILTLISNMFTNINLTDMETCYKAFRSEIIKKIIIEENRFGFEPEITAKISKIKCRIFEVGISYYGRTYEEGKKIGWKDGIRALYCIIKYNIFK